MFYSMEGAIRELDQIFPQEDFTAPAPKEQPEDAFLTTHQLNKVFADGFQALKEINTAFPKASHCHHGAERLGQDDAGQAPERPV